MSATIDNVQITSCDTTGLAMFADVTFPANAMNKQVFAEIGIIKSGKFEKILQDTFSLEDPDGDELTYAWSVKRESQARQHGGDKEDAIEDLQGVIAEQGGASVQVAAPAEAGAYRLFVYVYDGQGHAAHANIPFYVKAK